MIARKTRPRRVSLKKAARVGPQWSTITAKGKPLRKANPERQKKAAARQRKKHQAYMASECRRIVDARAGDYCEAAVSQYAIAVPTWHDDGSPGGVWLMPLLMARCSGLASDHHHLTYARYGGMELPRDILKGCERCHDYLEALKPAGNRYTRARSA